VRTTSRSWDKGVLTDLCLTMYSSAEVYKFLNIVSSLATYRLKFPDGAVYIVTYTLEI